MDNKFDSVERMKRILVIEGNIPDLTGAAKKLQEESAKELKGHLPADMEMESIPVKDFSTLPEQVHVATREAATNTDLDM